jgi:hypothetical protein
VARAGRGVRPRQGRQGTLGGLALVRPRRVPKSGPGSDRGHSRAPRSLSPHRLLVGVCAIHSSSSLTLPSHVLSSPHHPNRINRDKLILGYSYTRGPSTTSSQTPYRRKNYRHHYSPLGIPGRIYPPLIIL